MTTDASCAVGRHVVVVAVGAVCVDADAAARENAPKKTFVRSSVAIGVRLDPRETSV